MGDYLVAVDRTKFDWSKWEDKFEQWTEHINKTIHIEDNYINKTIAATNATIAAANATIVI